VREVAPALLLLQGCAAVSAAKIVGEAAGARRFKSRAAFARWNGTAPIPVWSGSTNFRLNRGGNRQVNTALHRIAMTQARLAGAGHDYLESRTARGDSTTEAMRMLRRRLSDEVFRRLLVDEPATPNSAHDGGRLAA
jgi:transposase